MMDNSVCMALVPYEGSYRHASFLERIFAKRRWLYFFLLPLTVASAFSGTYYYAVYAANGVSVPFADSMISVFGFSSDSFFVLLFLLTAAYTVFSPSGALVLLVPVSFSLGYYTATLYDIAGFCMYFVFFSLVQAAFALFLIIYAAELCHRVDITRCGFRFILGWRNNLALFCKSLVFAALFVADVCYIDYCIL